jgi:AcrR family transcriptional regulator
VPESTAKTRRRTRIEDLRRGELLDAAIRVIAEQGFDRTTIREIAQAADAASGSVHYYFKTKADLLEGAYAETERRQRALRDQTLEGLKGIARLRMLVDLAFTGDGAGPEWAVEIDLWQQAVRDARFRGVFDEANIPYIALIAEALRDARELGEIDDDVDPDRSALELAALLDGLGLYCRVTDHTDESRARAVVHARLDDWLKKPRQRSRASS